jgi:hypothetical protein
MSANENNQNKAKCILKPMIGVARSCPLSAIACGLASGCASTFRSTSIKPKALMEVTYAVDRFMGVAPHAPFFGNGKRKNFGGTQRVKG